MIHYNTIYPASWRRQWNGPMAHFSRRKKYSNCIWRFPIQMQLGSIKSEFHFGLTYKMLKSKRCLTDHYLSISKALLRSKWSRKQYTPNRLAPLQKHSILLDVSSRLTPPHFFPFDFCMHTSHRILLSIFTCHNQLQAVAGGYPFIKILTCDSVGKRWKHYKVTSFWKRRAESKQPNVCICKQ